MRLSFVILAAVPLGIGCSSDEGSNSPSASLDCAWLAGNNCWKSTLSQAESCLPPPSESGTLSADRKSCTYATGDAVVTFDSALTLPLPDDPVWSFTVMSGGQPCLRFEDTASGGFTLTVNGQTFTEAPAGFGLQVTCPDQTTFSNSNGFDLLSCDGGFFGGLPGKAWSDTSTSVSFNLLGGADGSANIFRCRTP
jgi:hypothetical protein